MKASKERTKNDIAWEKLFEKYRILEEVEINGFFEIESTQINQERESRLMAKFDHYVNLPKIFRDNHLSLLSISRSKYVIGHFDMYCKVEYSSKVGAKSVESPLDIESIDSTNLYSESSALHFAFNTGVINDLAGEETFYTVSGRMSTDKFSFNIGSAVGNSPYLIDVVNSQCEVDGGFEGKNAFLLIEAKNHLVDDLLVRQLYYPYRLWSSKLRNKKVIPILMTYSYDEFSFFIYEFEDDLNYNSLTLVEQKNYVIGSEEIERDDVFDVLTKLNLVAEPNEVPFPQADRFERVVDLLSLLMEKDLERDEITQNYQFDTRQTQYYTDACRYIGLITKYRNPLTKEIGFCLTDEGRVILGKRHKKKYLALIRKILQHKVFYKVFELAVNSGEIPSGDEVCKVMSESGLDIGDSTVRRRSRTVRKWIEWVWSQID